MEQKHPGLGLGEHRGRGRVGAQHRSFRRSSSIRMVGDLQRFSEDLVSGSENPLSQIA